MTTAKLLASCYLDKGIYKKRGEMAIERVIFKLEFIDIHILYNVHIIGL